LINSVVCITGPESSGKSTLAFQLSNSFKIPLVSEFARDYLNSLDNPSNYTSSHLLYIAQSQLLNLQRALSQNRAVIMDTGIEVVKIWHEEKFGQSLLLDDRLSNQERLVTHYILCSPDIPWEKDPLRENPSDRDRLFTLYEALLKKNSSTYLTVSGSEKERLEAARIFIQ